MCTNNSPARQEAGTYREPVPPWHPERRLLQRWPHLRVVAPNWAPLAAVVWAGYLERRAAADGKETGHA